MKVKGFLLLTILFVSFFSCFVKVSWAVDEWVQVAPIYESETSIYSLCVFDGGIYGGTYPNSNLLKWNGVNAWTQVAPKYVSETGIYSLVVLNGEIYGGTSPNGNLLKWNGVNAWTQVAPKYVSETYINSLCVLDGEIYGGTYPNGNLLKWNGVDAWTQVAPKYVSETGIYSLVVLNGEIYGGTGPNGNLLKWNGVDAWTQVAPTCGSGIYFYSLVVLNGEIYGGTLFEGNLLKWNGVNAWTQVAPKYGSQTHVYSLCVLNSNIYGGTYPNGNLLKWNGVNAWTQVAPEYVSEINIRSLCVFDGGIYGGTYPNSNLLKYANTAPVNGAGSITDMDDTNNVYAQRKLYTGSSVATDADGYADIHYMEFRIKQGATTRAAFQYHQDDDTFSIITGSTEWTLDASSSDSSAGNTITVTWKFSPQWDAVEEADLEIELYCIDAAAAADTDTAQTDYFDVITRLVTRDFAADVSSTSINTPFLIGGKVRYAMTTTGYNASTSYPPDAQFTAVKIYTDDEVFVGQDTTITNGVFSVNATSISAIGPTAYVAWLDLVLDYTNGYAIDGDVVYVTTEATFPFVDFLSNAFAFFGLAGAVTGTIYTTLFAFVTWFNNAAPLMVSLMTSIITLIFFVAGSVIYWLALFVNFFVGLFTIIGDVIDGTTPYTTGLSNIWNLIGFETWAAAVPLFAFIFWWDSMIKRNKQSGRGEIEIIVGDLQIVSYIIGEVWNWIYTVFNFVLNVMGQIASRF